MGALSYFCIVCTTLVCSNFCHNVIVNHSGWEMFVCVGGASISVLTIKRVLFDLCKSKQLVGMQREDQFGSLDQLVC